MIIERELLKTFKNILELDNNEISLDIEYEILTSIRDRSLFDTYKLLLEKFSSSFSSSLDNIIRGLNNQDPETVHSSLLDLMLSSEVNPNLEKINQIVHAIKKDEVYDFWISLFKLTKSDLDLNLLKGVLQTVKHENNIEKDLFDSFSNNQLVAKKSLLNAVNNLDILNKDSIVVIFGSWYSSVLTSMLKNDVKHIVNFDLDEAPLRVAKNNLFKELNNVSYIKDDVFKTYRDVYLDTNLIINTSCEHMPPMKEWPWFQKGALKTDSPYKHKFGSPKLSSNCYFAFQSNNMFGIEGHINCVNSLQEFEDQMPERAEILYREEVEDTRGTRYMLVGKLVSI